MIKIKEAVETNINKNIYVAYMEYQHGDADAETSGEFWSKSKEEMERFVKWLIKCHDNPDESFKTYAIWAGDDDFIGYLEWDCTVDDGGLAALGDDVYVRYFDQQGIEYHCEIVD